MQTCTGQLHLHLDGRDDASCEPHKHNKRGFITRTQNGFTAENQQEERGETLKVPDEDLMSENHLVLT